MVFFCLEISVFGCGILGCTLRRGFVVDIFSPAWMYGGFGKIRSIYCVIQHSVTRAKTLLWTAAELYITGVHHPPPPYFISKISLERR